MEFNKHMKMADVPLSWRTIRAEIGKTEKKDYPLPLIFP